MDGATAFLSQAVSHQILFMEFADDVDLPEHAHSAQTGFVLQGRIDLVIDGQEFTFCKGDRYHIPAGVRHSGRVHAGYADITFYDEPSRYAVGKGPGPEAPRPARY
ncbi:cupin domain-containing protein [Desulfoprunum benzoelyticum]|nr:cupin domain-containing protein [Desulfoprunum benzoelyticum]